MPKNYQSKKQKARTRAIAKNAIERMMPGFPISKNMIRQYAARDESELSTDHNHLFKLSEIENEALVLSLPVKAETSALSVSAEMQSVEILLSSVADYTNMYRTAGMNAGIEQPIQMTMQAPENAARTLVEGRHLVDYVSTRQMLKANAAIVGMRFVAEPVAPQYN